MKEGYVKSFDGYEVYRYLWNDVENPIGIVQHHSRDIYKPHIRQNF